MEETLSQEDESTRIHNAFSPAIVFIPALRLFRVCAIAASNAVFNSAVVPNDRSFKAVETRV
jgi:hypothetical protein